MDKLKIDTKQDRLQLFLRIAYPEFQEFVEAFNSLIGKPVTKQRVSQLKQEEINNYIYLRAFEQLGLNINWYLNGDNHMFADNDTGRHLRQIMQKTIGCAGAKTK